MKRRTLIIGIAAGAIAAAGYLGYRRCSPTATWRDQPKLALRVAIVDYTVPFTNYREHAGVMWVLNHLRVEAPDAAPTWMPALHYVGYQPTQRDAPRRLLTLDPASLDVIYVADTYGVYRDDLAHIPEQLAHMDYSQLVFGGLSDGDAQTLGALVARGGAAIAEFNTFCEPTTPAVRARMEELFGVTWTQWVGRVFQNPRDVDDVPHWFPREFARQFPDRPFPTRPMLVLVGPGGAMHVFEGSTAAEVAPRVVLTDAGALAFPDARSGAPYYYWFALMRAAPTTTVYAQMKLPDRDDLRATLDALGAPQAPLAMAEAHGHPGRAIYFAGDLGEPDFEIGAYDALGAINAGQRRVRSIVGVTQAPVFWNFYAPVARRLLADISASQAPAK